MKLLDYLNLLDEEIQRSIQELENKNYRIRESNKVLKKLILIQNEKELEERNESVENSKTEAKETKELDHPDPSVQLPAKLDEILRLAKATRLPSKSTETKTVENRPSAPTKSVDKSPRNPAPTKLADIVQKNNLPFHRSSRTESKAPSEPTPPPTSVSSKELDPTQTAIVSGKPSANQKLKAYLYDQLHVLSKVRLLSRLKTLYISNPKLTTSRQSVLLKFNRSNSHPIYHTMSKCYSFPNFSSSFSKESLQQEFHDLQRITGRSNAIRYISQKIGKFTNEMLEELFMIWYRACNLLENIYFYEIRRNDEHLQLKTDQLSRETTEVQISFASKHFYVLLRSRLSFAFAEIFPPPVSSFSNDNRNGIKKNVKVRKGEMSFGVEQDDTTLTKAYIRIDNYHNQLIHCLQYVIEYSLVRKLDILMGAIYNLKTEQLNQSKLGSRIEDNRQLKLKNENQWLYLLKIFRVLHTILIHEAVKWNCVFLQKVSLQSRSEKTVSKNGQNYADLKEITDK